ncbi:hypothetical protein L2E82_11842 [Cichorium intybus]|uniref:Uncharacterized protein n=1 Tax=Cichorium intybus TaxID=13427 RepID=A0ACB9GFH7_CICIN|nr:hypothetical protein L2E82_11842 [Cichorium intybus]
MWKTKDFKDRQNYEIEEGGFGLGNIVSENQISYENKNNELASEHEGTEFPFDEVSDGKKNIEEIVSICMTKFPNESITKDLVKRMKDLFWVNFSPKDNNSEFCGDEHLNEQKNYQEGDNVMNEADNGGKEDSGLVEFKPIQPLQQVAAEVSDTDIDVEEYIALEIIIGEKDGESSYVTPKNIVKGKEISDSPWSETLIKKLDEEVLRQISSRDQVNISSVSKKLKFENTEFPSFDLQISQLLDDAVFGDISKGGNEANIRMIENEEQMVNIKRKKTEKEVVQNVRTKPKRNVVVTEVFKSPFVNRAVDLNEKLSVVQEVICQMMFRCDPDKESMEILFETSPGDILTRHQFESMRPDHSIHRFVIDCWTTVLNFEENKLKSKSSPSRLFFNTQILTENLLDDSTTFLKRFRIFDDNVNCFISELNREIDFNNLNLVFFPIHNGDQFYAIVFNLTSMEIIILDTMRLSGKIEDMYGKIPQLLYFGEKEGKWDIELGKENNKTRMRIAKLRGFYAAKFATHTINRKRKRNMEEANEFAKIDRKTRAKMTKDGIDARNQLEMGNK